MLFLAQIADEAGVTLSARSWDRNSWNIQKSVTLQHLGDVALVMNCSSFPRT